MRKLRTSFGIVWEQVGQNLWFDFETRVRLRLVRGDWIVTTATGYRLCTASTREFAESLYFEIASQPLNYNLVTGTNYGPV